MIILLETLSTPLGNTDPTSAEKRADITNLLNMSGSPKGTFDCLTTLMKSVAGEEELGEPNLWGVSAATSHIFSSGRSNEHIPARPTLLYSKYICNKTNRSSGLTLSRSSK